MAQVSERKLRNIIERSYLVDQDATERELIDMGFDHMVHELKIDYAAGRLQENFATLTGKRVVVESIGATCAGSVMTPLSTPEAG